jgi:hypothetical protein
MTADRSAVFLIHLVQDVNVLRPLIFMAAHDFEFATLLLVSTKFNGRDPEGIWSSELHEICAGAGARLEFFDDDLEAYRQLTGVGLLFSASESNLKEHETTHNVFRYAPATYLRVTVQHGFECVGFRHSADHVRAHGKTASFAADILCTWYGLDQLTSLAPSQRGKVMVTGPTSVLQAWTGVVEPSKKKAVGLVCENLHSVRFAHLAVARKEFVQTFGRFARSMARRNRRVVLRPHSGGQYLLRNKVGLPANIETEGAPLYRLDLRRFAYGISAPSSVLIDMLLADIPTAVWRDSVGKIDASNYDGLATITSAREWIDFARAAEKNPEPFLRRQREFLERQQLSLNQADVFCHFARLFEAARRLEVRPPGSVAERERVLFVANGNLPTLQLSFDRPLAPLVARGEISTRLLAEPELRRFLDATMSNGATSQLADFLDRYQPSLIIFCRYSGPGFRPILNWARREQVPVIYHIDDDLLGVPREIGERKFAMHNASERIETVAALLNSADLIYASTEKLKARLLNRWSDISVVAGEIYCASPVLRRPSRTAPCTVGYMASADHAHNLAMVLPAIEGLLDRNPQVRFELFGSIPVPESLKRFADRIAMTDRIADYDRFLEEFASRGWGIGICPLVPIDFNLCKANTKWVEYTAAGAAVVASRGTVYDECCADGCGILADTSEEWLSALDLLVNNVDERLATVGRAQVKLEQKYSVTRLREQVLNVIAQAHDRARSTRAHDKDKETSVCLTR